MELAAAPKKAKGFLTNTFNTLAGKNGRKAAFLGWLAVANIATVFIPPVVSIASLFNIAVGAYVGKVAADAAKEHRRARFNP